MTDQTRDLTDLLSFPDVLLYRIVLFLVSYGTNRFFKSLFHYNFQMKVPTPWTTSIEIVRGGQQVIYGGC